MEVNLAPDLQAQIDLEEIGDFIADRGLDAADQVGKSWRPSAGL
jgi:plasmid stabilization system protein ParE